MGILMKATCLLFKLEGRGGSYEGSKPVTRVDRRQQVCYSSWQEGVDLMKAKFCYSSWQEGVDHVKAASLLIELAGGVYL